MIQKETRPLDQYMCQKCGIMIPKWFTLGGVQFCFTCGTKIKQTEVTEDIFTCGHCHKIVNNWWGYCPYCSSKL